MDTAPDSESEMEEEEWDDTIAYDMVQLPYPEDKAKLPVWLYVQRVYTEKKDGSQNVSTVLRNGTGKPMHLAARQLVGHIVAANQNAKLHGFTRVGSKAGPEWRTRTPVDVRTTPGAPNESAGREQ